MHIGWLTAPLFVPGDRPERFGKAAASGADAIIIDLEDAVAPAAKPAARENLRLAHNLGCAVVVRINGRATQWHVEDLAAVRQLAPAGVILPKAESADDIGGTAACGVPIIALVETAAGLAAARAIAASGAARIAFGSLDFCADIGSEHTRDALLAARSELVLASRLARLPKPIDGVTADLRNAEQLAGDVRHARELGFGGKLCIHPSQVADVMSGFEPAADEIAWAAKVLAAPADGATTVDGRMIDAPVRAWAHGILERHRRRR